MAQQLSTALAEYLSWVPSTHIGQLITTCNSSSKGSDTLFWLTFLYTHIHMTHTYKHIIKNKIFNKINYEVNMVAHIW